MRQSVPLALSLALAATVQIAGAQEAKPRELYRVGRYDVPIAHGEHFVQTVGKVAEAAKKGQVKGGVDWYLYRDGSRFLAVFPIDNMAELDDLQRGERAWKGTAAEAEYKLAAAELGSMPYSARTEVVERLTGLQHLPAEAAPARHIEVMDYVIQPGRTKDFEALAKEAIAVMGEAGYPYRVDVYKTVTSPASTRW